MEGDRKNVDLLRGIELFAELPDDRLSRINDFCRWQDFQAGQQIIDHLDRTTDCFLIAGGSVRAIVNSASGKEIAFRDCGAGEVVGELSALDGRPRSASVTALSDARIARLSSTQLWDVVRLHPEVAATLIRKLTAMVRDLSDRVVAISAMPVGPRVQAELLRIAIAVGIVENRAVILHPPTHDEIASRVAARREAVTRELSRLTETGVISRRGRELIVNDVAALRQSVETMLDVASP